MCVCVVCFAYVCVSACASRGYVCVSACAMRLRLLKLLRWSSDSELTLKLYTDDKSFRSSYIYILHV